MYYGYYHHNPDADIRHYQRLAAAGDIQAEAKVLGLRIHAGELDPHHVELAASLGDEASLMLFPENAATRTARSLGVTVAELRGDDSIGYILSNSELRDGRLLVTIAADFAEHVLPNWNRAYHDERPSLAIRTVRDWISGSRLEANLETIVDEVMEIGDAALEEVIYDDALNATLVAASEETFGAIEQAAILANPAWSAQHAAYHAAMAVSGSVNAVLLALDLPLGRSFDDLADDVAEIQSDAIRSSYFAGVNEAEERWQRLHLIEVLLRHQ